MSKIILAVIVTAIIVGGGVYYRQSMTQSVMKTYSVSEKYSFEYPKEYSVVSTGGDNIENSIKSSTFILTVSKGDTTKLEIFKASEYPVDRAAVGFSGEETPAEADAYMKTVQANSAKELLKVCSYDVWLYYGENDSQAKNELKAIFDSIKEIQSTPTQQAEKQEARSLADCSKLGSSWIQFSNDGTSLSFCYKNSWGTTKLRETEISPTAKAGTVYYISFSDAPGQPLVSNNPYPLISYSTLDFQKLGDSDVPPIIDWKALDFSKSETELALLFPNENATTQKLTVNDKQVLKVSRDFIEPLSQKPTTPLDYFMPNVVINGTTYNLHIIGSPEQEADLDKLLESIAL